MDAKHNGTKTQMSDNSANMRSDHSKAGSLLRRCWWTVPLGIACGLVAAYGVLRSFEPTYKASHYLKADHDYIIDESTVDRSPSQLATERRLIHSELVLAPVLTDPELREAPSLSEPETAERNLRENLAFESDHDPTLLVISYTDTDRRQRLTFAMPSRTATFDCAVTTTDAVTQTLSKCSIRKSRGGNARRKNNNRLSRE